MYGGLIIVYKSFSRDTNVITQESLQFTPLTWKKLPGDI